MSTPTDDEQDAPTAPETDEGGQSGTEQPTPAQTALLLGLLRPAPDPANAPPRTPLTHHCH